MGLEQLNFEGKNKVEVAIMRLKEFEPPEGYDLAFSGGKDSVVIYDLAVKSGVKFTAHYSQTGIDPPELIYFIRDNYPNLIYEKPDMTIWEGIQYHGMPSRIFRWCCEMLKEKRGSGRRIITGIRWQESAKRKARRLFEVCHKDDTKYYLNPIIDWTSKAKQLAGGGWLKGGDVWEYIESQNLPYCSLYDEGFKRLGCVLCPMATATATKHEMERWPKLAEAWRRACIKRYESRPDLESAKRWNSGEAFWKYWLSRKGEPKVNDAQCIMFDN